MENNNHARIQMICKNSESCIEKWQHDNITTLQGNDLMDHMCPHILQHDFNDSCNDSCCEEECSINGWHSLIEDSGCKPHLSSTPPIIILELTDKDFFI